jgi:hypothetical protein
MDKIIKTICTAIIQLVTALEKNKTGAFMLFLIILSVAGVGLAWR